MVFVFFFWGGGIRLAPATCPQFMALTRPSRGPEARKPLAPLVPCHALGPLGYALGSPSSICARRVCMSRARQRVISGRKEAKMSQSSEETMTQLVSAHWHAPT